MMLDGNLCALREYESRQDSQEMAWELLLEELMPTLNEIELLDVESEGYEEKIEELREECYSISECSNYDWIDGVDEEIGERL